MGVLDTFPDPQHRPIKMSEPFKPTWNAELYAKARPTYPAEAIEEILSAPRSSSSKEPLNVVDLGAGTGICTRMLIEACADDHSSHKLASISAFDASVSMLDQLNKELMQEQADPNRQALIPRLKQQKKLDASLKSHVAQATFENFNVSSIGLQGQVDLVVIAQVSRKRKCSSVLRHCTGIPLVQGLQQGI